MCIATLSLAENSGDTRKVKLAVESPEDSKKLKQMKRAERTTAATQRRTSVGPVTRRNPKFEKQWLNCVMKFIFLALIPCL
jgi:hypothetical protein